IVRYRYRHCRHLPIPPLMHWTPLTISTLLPITLPSAVLCSDVDMSRENRRVVQSRLSVDEFGNGNKSTMSSSS
ncbi:hypothetical protein M405DRAFT_806503, partial [Rhizopogon salebrosus TDB-379]